MKKYFLFDDEQISGKTYVLRLFVSVLLLVFLVGIWLVASTAYKRARSLGWDEGFSNVISFLIIIQLSIGAWLDSLSESDSGIFIVTIPLFILQFYMVFKNAKPVKSSATGEKAGRIIGQYLFTPIKWKNILIYVGLGLLLKVFLHFSLFPEKSIELDTENKTYVDGSITSGWYVRTDNGLKIAECCFEKGTCGCPVGKNCACVTLVDEARLSSALTKNGEKYSLEDVRIIDEYGNVTARVFYYPYKNSGLISHFSLIFKSKLWLFLISFALTIFLTLIFRYKISSKS